MRFMAKNTLLTACKDLQTIRYVGVFVQVGLDCIRKRAYPARPMSTRTIGSLSLLLFLSNSTRRVPRESVSALCNFVVQCL